MKPDLNNNEATQVATSSNDVLSTSTQSEIVSHPTTGRQDIIGLLIFLLLSGTALWDAQFQSAVPENIRAFLGPAPPVMLINVALAVYLSCALLQILPRALDTKYRYKGWSHIAYLGGFYVFYFFADALDHNLPALFAIGIVLMTFEIIAVQVRRKRSLQSA